VFLFLRFPSACRSGLCFFSPHPSRSFLMRLSVLPESILFAVFLIFFSLVALRFSCVFPPYFGLTRPALLFSPPPSKPTRLVLVLPFDSVFTLCRKNRLLVSFSPSPHYPQIDVSTRLPEFEIISSPSFKINLLRFDVLFFWVLPREFLVCPFPIFAIPPLAPPIVFRLPC